MPATLPKPVADAPRKMLKVSSEADRKPLADFKRDVGQAIDRALRAARIEKQDAAYQMGVDAGQVSRWVTGSETPQMSKLWMLGPKFQKELVCALAELAGAEVDTRIRFPRSA